MKQEFSLAHLTVMALPPPAMIYVAARAGYDCVSLRTIPLELPGESDYGLAGNPELLAQTQGALEATCLRLNDIELARVHDGTIPSAYVPELEVCGEARRARCAVEHLVERSRLLDRHVRRDLRPREAV